MIKTFKIVLFILLLSLPFNVANSDILKFEGGSYEGEVKKGKAYGEGIFTFSDGSKYEGKFKKNKIHGKGKYTDLEGNVFEGKWRWGKFRNKIDKKTREIINLNFDTGKLSTFEIKGKGTVSMQWFEAEKTSSGTYELTTKGKRDMDKATEENKGGGSGGGDGGGSGGGGGGC